MRRFLSIGLAAGLAVILAAVLYTFKLRWEKARDARVVPMPAVRTGVEGQAPRGWNYKKEDPETNRTIIDVHAASFEGTHDPSTFELTQVVLRLYDKRGESYTFVQSEKALFDEGSGVMKSGGPVLIVINVPAAQDAADPAVAAKRVRVRTTGVIYETKTGKAQTSQPATFLFTEGNGAGVGADYDPNTKLLHLRSQVTLDWVGRNPANKKIHVEAGDLVYKEAEQKVFLSPWSKLTRGGTSLEGGNAVVTLDQGILQKVEGDGAHGQDRRADRVTAYSADHMSALFDDDGVMVQMLGTGHARVESKQPKATTLLTGDKADLRFATVPSTHANEKADSELHLVLTDGHSVAEATPVPQPGVLTGDTRILRSEHIELELKPGGKDLKEIRTSSQAQLEFKPNRPEQPHRVVDASHVRVLYGNGSYVDTFLAWNAATHTDKAVAKTRVKLDGQGKPIPPAPALTWSDELKAKFEKDSNEVATVDQSGNFRYQEGTRKAWADSAFLEQKINRITLTGGARVLDDTGSASGDRIVMNQVNGDMDARGHVRSTHQPDRNQKPGTSMLDAAESMQAQADAMETRQDNSQVFYQGHAAVWQGADRIAADSIAIDRDAQSLQASGNVVSELLDNRATTPGSPGGIYTVVRAPQLQYQDDTRIANYTGGVRLVRDKITVDSINLQAMLNPKDASQPTQSSLNRAVATGDVSIVDQMGPGWTRTGTGQRCEYYTKEDKVVLNGGAPQMIDTKKGIIRGQQLTYFSEQDKLIVDGLKDRTAFTRMKKH